MTKILVVNQFWRTTDNWRITFKDLLKGLKEGAEFLEIQQFGPDRCRYVFDGKLEINFMEYYPDSFRNHIAGFRFDYIVSDIWDVSFNEAIRPVLGRGGKRL